MGSREGDMPYSLGTSINYRIITPAWECLSVLGSETLEFTSILS